MTCKYFVGQGLLGDWVVILYWGAISKPHGHQESSVHESEEAASAEFDQLIELLVRDGFEHRRF